MSHKMLKTMKAFQSILPRHLTKSILHLIKNTTVPLRQLFQVLIRLPKVHHVEFLIKAEYFLKEILIVYISAALWF